MTPDQELESRLRILRDNVTQTPSMIDQVMRRVEETSIAPAVPAHFWRRQLMQSATLKKLRWVVPVAIAAAIILVVGIRPHHDKNGSPASGRVYAIADVPDLLRAARTLHIQCSIYQREASKPDSTPAKVEGEMWLDLQHGRRCTSRLDHRLPAEIGTLFTICDGQYVMEEYYAKIARGGYSKGVRFKKLTPYQALLETRQGDFLIQLFGHVDQVAGFAVTSQEQIDGQSFNVWEGTVDIATSKYRLKVWLAPATGDIARVQYWDEHDDGSPWRMFMDFERIERDVVLADNLFSTEPRPGYKLENTKDTAPTQILGGFAEIERAWPYALHRHISFALPDGSVLLGWGVWDKSNTDQEPLFKNLTPGGELPQLPARPVSLTPAPAENAPLYIGRHLAYTRLRQDYCVEWTLYVPSAEPPPADSVLSYLCKFDLAANKDQFGCWFDGISGSLPISSAEDFETWVRGAIADTSDTGTAPDHLTFEYTLDLCRRIRAELAEQGR